MQNRPQENVKVMQNKLLDDIDQPLITNRREAQHAAPEPLQRQIQLLPPHKTAGWHPRRQ